MCQPDWPWGAQIAEVQFYPVFPGEVSIWSAGLLMQMHPTGWGPCPVPPEPAWNAR